MWKETALTTYYLKGKIRAAYRTFLSLTGWSIANKMNEVPLKSMCPNPSHYLSNGEKRGKLLF